MSRKQLKNYLLNKIIENDIIIQDDEQEETLLIASNYDAFGEYQSDFTQEEEEKEEENEEEKEECKVIKKLKPKIDSFDENEIFFDELKGKVFEIQSELPITLKKEKKSSLLLCRIAAFDFEHEIDRILGQQQSSSRQLKTKRFWVSQNRNNWQIQSHGLECILADYPFFNFVASSNYINNEIVVYNARKLYNGNNMISEIMKVLRKKPFHLSANITLAGMLYINSDFQQCYDILNRCIHAFESAACLNYSPFILSNELLPQTELLWCRTPDIFFTSYESIDDNHLNIMVMQTFYLYLRLMEYRGVPAISLEMCKLLLSMDVWTDRSLSLLVIDKYALMCKEYIFLQNFTKNIIIELCQKKLNKNPTSDIIVDLSLMLPNFAYSVALTYFSNSIEIKNIIQIKASSFSTLDIVCNDSDICILYILRAILLFPNVCRRLISKLGFRANANVSNSAYIQYRWKDLLFSDFFTTSDYCVLSDCYCESIHSLWNKPEYIYLLHSCIAHIIILSSNEKEFQIMSTFKNNLKKKIYALNISFYENIKLNYFSLSNQILPPLFKLVKIKHENYTTNPQHEERDIFTMNINNLHTTVPNISLESDSIVVFIQSICPWNNIDISGLYAKPINIYNMFMSFVKNIFVA